MRTKSMCVIRLAAAAILFTLGPQVLRSSDLLAAELGGCSAQTNAACITKHDTYENKACTSGGGTSCITCIADPESVCTWDGGDVLDYYN